MLIKSCRITFTRRLRAHSNQDEPMQLLRFKTNSSCSWFKSWKFVDDILVDRFFSEKFFQWSRLYGEGPLYSVSFKPIYSSERFLLFEIFEIFAKNLETSSENGCDYQTVNHSMTWGDCDKWSPIFHYEYSQHRIRRIWFRWKVHEIVPTYKRS